MRTTIRQLQLASGIVIASGALILLGAYDKTSAGVKLWGDLLFWPLDDDVQVTKEGRLFSAVLGGVMIGWGVVYWGLASMLETDPVAVRRVFLTSIGAWFVFDCVGSVAAGAPLNLIFNVGYLLLFVVPFWRLGSLGDGSGSVSAKGAKVVSS